MASVQRQSGKGVRVGTVYAVGRNYREHAKEMGVEAEPVVFMKPAACLIGSDLSLPWPEGCHELHYEVELVLLLEAGGTRLSVAAARDAISDLAIGIDLTARDLQGIAKQKGQPWARSKGFPGAAPVSEFVPAGPWLDRHQELDLELEVGGRLRQRGSAAAMIRGPAELVAMLSHWFPLEAGDVVFTGTPDGVGPIQPGERVVARSHALGLSVEVAFAGAPSAPPVE